MAIDLAWLDQHLIDLLVDEGSDTWTADIRAKAITEALVATVRLRPEIHSVETNIPINGDLYTFTLPAAYDQLLAVYGVIEPTDGGNVIRSLSPKTEQAALDEDACWRSSSQSATHFVHNPTVAPYTVYLIGQAPAASELRCVVQTTVAEVTAPLSGSLPIRVAHLPELVDYALKRLSNRIDTPPNRMAYHDQTFKQGTIDKLNTDIARNPTSHVEPE